MTKSRYREIDVSGRPRELGRLLGEAAREEIRGFCDVALARVNKIVPVSRETAERIAVASLAYAAVYGPDMVEELEGVAEAAGVALADLMCLQVRNQLQPEADAACTSLAVAGAGLQTATIVAQNWDNDPVMDDFTIVVTRRPAGKPALVNVTQAGLIAYIGFSEARIGLCLNTLPAPARPVGVPHYFTVRGIYEADSLDSAVHAVRRAHRAIPANIMLATPQGPADLEVTLDDVRVLQPESSGGVTHANHCLAPELAPVNSRFPELIQSYARQRRIDELLAAAGDRPVGVEAVKAILKDHDNYPRSICRHANDDPVTGFWRTIISVIIEPDKRQMHISRGTPCEHAYETYTLN